jgi:hypothetical protein
MAVLTIFIFFTGVYTSKSETSIRKSFDTKYGLFASPILAILQHTPLFGDWRHMSAFRMQIHVRMARCWLARFFLLTASVIIAYTVYTVIIERAGWAAALNSAASRIEFGL